MLLNYVIHTLHLPVTGLNQGQAEQEDRRAKG